ncbi:DMP19 family protein [Nocardia sp. NPDC004722]
MNVYNERLQQLGERATRRLEHSEALDDATRELAEITSLAAYFDYQVKNGGFGQLIYNLGRDWLEHCDDMLRAVGAQVAYSYYLRAITRCTEDLADFDTFMTDFTTPTPLGQDLLMLTVEYFRADTGFDDEITDFLAHADTHL